ncbi:HD domain-containing phosphohydrolase [Desulfosporosinus sp. I2]|uniref:HD-GYP domain-containing protein n=1 Tax=Desulfosporosinus sp. I2 TaxID=1617025 RepID=UPI000AC47ED8
MLHHQERWDGRGYPDGLREDKIPLGSRIIGVADSVDAITSIRPYRIAISGEECWEEILLNKGTQFDPVAVEASKKLWKRWKVRYKVPQKDNMVTSLDYGCKENLISLLGMQKGMCRNLKFRHIPSYNVKLK